MKRTASGCYVVYGGMDHPGRARPARSASSICAGVAHRVELPTTCWHVAVHATEDLFYTLSFRVAAQEGRDWHEWAMSYFCEYAFALDAESGAVVRHWAAGRETPADINSDVTVSDTELIWCNGGSQTVVLLDLDSFADYRILDERPDAATTSTSLTCGTRSMSKTSQNSGTVNFCRPRMTTRIRSRSRAVNVTVPSSCSAEPLGLRTVPTRSLLRPRRTGPPQACTRRCTRRRSWRGSWAAADTGCARADG